MNHNALHTMSHHPHIRDMSRGAIDVNKDRVHLTVVHHIIASHPHAYRVTILTRNSHVPLLTLYDKGAENSDGSMNEKVNCKGRGGGIYVKVKGMLNASVTQGSRSNLSTELDFCELLQHTSQSSNRVNSSSGGVAKILRPPSWST